MGSESTAGGPQELRIGDAERESATSALGEHLAAGRLGVDEYADRSAKVVEARTRSALTALFTDLPQPHPRFDGASAPAAGQAHGGEVATTDGAAVARRPGDGMVVKRGAAAVTTVAWIGAVAALVLTDVSWLVLAAPIVLSVLFASFWGKGWQHELHHPYRGSDEEADDDRDRREYRRDRHDRRRGRY